MFVDQRARIGGELELVSRIAHRQRQRRRLLRIETAEIDCHQESGHLIISNSAGGIKPDDLLDLLRAERFAVALGLNQREEVHVGSETASSSLARNAKPKPGFLVSYQSAAASVSDSACGSFLRS